MSWFVIRIFASNVLVSKNYCRKTHLWLRCFIQTRSNFENIFYCFPLSWHKTKRFIDPKWMNPWIIMFELSDHFDIFIANEIMKIKHQIVLINSFFHRFSSYCGLFQCVIWCPLWKQKLCVLFRTQFCVLVHNWWFYYQIPKSSWNK